MGRKKTVVTTTETPEPEIIPQEEEIYIEDPLAEILALYPNASRKIKVMRYTNAGLEYICTTQELIDEEFLQDVHGPGRYLLRVSIDGVKKMEYELRIAGKPGQRGSSSDNKPQAAESKTESKTGFLEQLVLGLVGNRNAQASTPVSELAEALKTVHSMTGGGNNAQQYTDGLKAGIELGKGMNGGGGDWKTEAFRMLKDTLPALASVIPGAMRGVPIAPGPGPVMAPAGANNLDAMLYGGIQRLKQQCLNQVPPGLVIDWALANATEENTQNFLRAAITRDFSAFETLDAEISKPPFNAWFREVHDGLRSAFASHDNLPDDSAGETGNG